MIPSVEKSFNCIIDSIKVILLKHVLSNIDCPRQCYNLLTFYIYIRQIKIHDTDGGGVIALHWLVKILSPYMDSCRYIIFVCFPFKLCNYLIVRVINDFSFF